jgi:serine protease Do
MDDTKPRKLDRRLLMLLAVQILLVLLLIGGLAYSIVANRPQAPMAEPLVANGTPDEGRRAAFDELATDSRRVVSQAEPFVVHLEIRRDGEAPLDADELEKLFGAAQDWSAAPTQGAGVIVDPEGYILTNAHVVRGAVQITVKLPDGKTAGGELIGIDSAADLALLKVDRTNLKAVEWGDSDRLARGDFVWAIGSPFGLESSVSFGIVSFTQRRLPTLPEVALLQTDAAINPGSSGGPLVDREGRVVGISTAILGRNHQGVGFAIPANVARRVVVELLSGEKQ